MSASTSSPEPGSTLSQRKPEIASPLRVCELDRVGRQARTRPRVVEPGDDIPEWLQLVPIDFEAGSA